MVIDTLFAITRHYEHGGLERVRQVLVDHAFSEYPFLTAKFRYYYRALRGAEQFHPFAVYAVDPGVIQRYVEWDVFEHFSNTARVRDGTWDRDARPLAALGKYVLLRRYLAGDLDADALDYDLLREYGYPHDEARQYARSDYGAYLSALRDSLAEEGVHIRRRGGESPTARFDHVAVDIARDGELLFDANGCHRLTIAHYLGLDRIPVRVNAIHSGWPDARAGPAAHPELTYLTHVPIPWRKLYALETGTPTMSGYRVPPDD